MADDEGDNSLQRHVYTYIHTHIKSFQYLEQDVEYNFFYKNIENKISLFIRLCEGIISSLIDYR